MKRDVSLVLLFILLGIAILAIIGLNLTGHVSWAPDFQGIFRAVPIKNAETNTTYVYIRIASTENVIAVQEIFSSPNCKVIDYSLNKDIEIFEFNENENTWIFANSSNNLDIELFYQIPYSCNVTSGKYFTVYSFSGNNWCNGADTNHDTIVDASDYLAIKRNMGKAGCSSPSWCSGADINHDKKVDSVDSSILASEFGKTSCSESSDSNIYFYAYQSPVINNASSNNSAIPAVSGSSSPGSSGSSGSSSSTQDTTAIKTNEIVQVITNEEYAAQSLSATERLAQISEETSAVDKYSGYVISILAVIAIGIIGFIVFSLFKSPKGSR